MTNHIPTILIPTIIILVALLLSITFLAVWYRRRYDPVPNQDPTSSSSHHPHSHSAREVEIHDTSAGDQVWFSRQVHRGTWRNWSLIIRNQRYTLHPNRTADPADPPFLLVAEPCSLAHERQAAETDKKLLATGYRGFYVCLVGWTRKSHKDICLLAERFVLPGLLRAADEGEVFEGIVQDFLKDLADRVLEPRRAVDYAWFRENVTCHWKDVEVKLMAGPRERERDEGKRPRSMLQLSSVDAGVRSWAYA